VTLCVDQMLYSDDYVSSVHAAMCCCALQCIKEGLGLIDQVAVLNWEKTQCYMTEGESDLPQSAAISRVPSSDATPISVSKHTAPSRSTAPGSSMSPKGKAPMRYFRKRALHMNKTALYIRIRALLMCLRAREGGGEGV